MDNPEPKNHARLAASIILVVIIGASLVGAAYLRSKSPQASTSTSTTTSQSTTTESPAPCAQSYPSQITNRTTVSNGTEITEVSYPALVMSPGSSMALCVSYGGSSYSGPAYNSVYAWESDGQTQPTQGVAINASPANVSIAQGQSAVVEYTVAAGQGSTGFYGLSVLQMCVPIPLAVGYVPSQVNSTDFPGLFGLRNCPAQFLSPRILGYTGASIAFLKTESKFSPSENVTNISVSSSPTSNGGENVTFTMVIHSFSMPITIGQPVGGAVRVFTGNPELTTLPAADYCSWYPNNQTAVNSMTIKTFENLPNDAPTLQLNPYSSANYVFSVVISGPIIARYTAMDVSSGPITVAYFPVSIAGQLQTISGSCDPLLG